MVLNVKILLDPKFYYQKLKELASKSKLIFLRVGSDVKKVFSAVRSGVSGATASFGTFIKSVLRGGGVLILYEGIKSLIKIGQHFYNSRIKLDETTGKLGNTFLENFPAKYISRQLGT